jgi:exonuclease SbcD
MKFIHTSDWHIGRFFQNVSLLEDQLFALQQIKKYAKQHQVDALVVAGDIFDRSVPPAEAVDALDQFLDEFTEELDIPVIMISGNHDSAKRLRFGSRYMRSSGVHILGDIQQIETPVEIVCDDKSVSFYGVPYHDPVEVREAFDTEVKSYDEAHTYLIEKIKAVRDNSKPSVLISHCFIDGAETSDSERPLSIGGADRVSYTPLADFSYVALGHLHGPQYKGEGHIRYSGSLLKYSFSEHKQSKGITLVEIQSDGSSSYEHLPLKPRHDLRVIEGEFDQILLEAQSAPNNEDYLLIKLTDTKDILDPMGRIRSVYPNVLQLERINFAIDSGSRLAVNESNEKTEAQVFEEFFEQVMGTELSESQVELLKETIDQAQKSMEA